MRHLFLLATIIMLGSTATAAVISENFNDETDYLGTFSVDSSTGFTGASVVWDADSGQDGTGDATIRTWATGGSGDDTAWYKWDLGGSYDFYDGGEGVVSIDVRTLSNVNTDWVQYNFYDSSDDVVAAKRYTFTDTDWHTVTLSDAFSGDETAVTYLKIVVARESGSSSSIYSYNDNFVATPEPATLGLLGLGALGLLRRRNR